MTTSIIILIIFVVVMIIDMVIRAKWKSDVKAYIVEKTEQIGENSVILNSSVMTNVQSSHHLNKTLVEGLIASNEVFTGGLEETSILNIKLIEDFVELSDSEYKRTIKQLMAEKDNAVAMHLQLITAIKSLKDNDRIKIQYRLDSITGLKNGKERKVPAAKNKNGGK